MNRYELWVKTSETANQINTKIRWFFCACLIRLRPLAEISGEAGLSQFAYFVPCRNVLTHVSGYNTHYFKTNIAIFYVRQYLIFIRNMSGEYFAGIPRTSI
jgi:hypothetical protein